jgi:hypothetical protein
MPQDIIEQIEPYRTSDSSRWARLASTVHWRRLVILLLREIVVELRSLHRSDLHRSDLRPPQEQDQ